MKFIPQEKFQITCNYIILENVPVRHGMSLCKLYGHTDEVTLLYSMHTFRDMDLNQRFITTVDDASSCLVKVPIRIREYESDWNISLDLTR